MLRKMIKIAAATVDRGWGDIAAKTIEPTVYTIKPATIPKQLRHIWLRLLLHHLIHSCCPAWSGLRGPGTDRTPASKNAPTLLHIPRGTTTGTENASDNSAKRSDTDRWAAATSSFTCGSQEVALARLIAISKAALSLKTKLIARLVRVNTSCGKKGTIQGQLRTQQCHISLQTPQSAKPSCNTSVSSCVSNPTIASDTAS